MQYFYSIYRSETEALLKAFDAEFTEPINKENKRLDKVKFCMWVLFHLYNCCCICAIFLATSMLVMLVYHAGHTL